MRISEGQEKYSQSDNDRVGSKMNLPGFLGRYPISKWVVPLFLLVLLAVGTLPNYLQGRWTWTEAPEVANIKPLQEVAKNGIELSDWQTVSQEELTIGAGEWLKQEIESDGNFDGNAQAGPTRALLYLHPQTRKTGTSSQPQMEWTDWDLANGVLGWKTDSNRALKFSISDVGNGSPANVEARFFRGWNQRQTYAVLQWYAWPGGGHPNLNRWFWADRRAQLADRRLPWVAVSVSIPIEPLGDIEEVNSLAISLGQQVQIALENQAWPEESAGESEK
ncbi:MAG: cyanoexosortase B system-associated protein [Cyanobacteriota bacterium]|nr:cyanoexosortase B system-associated protein [Cyanobacteriota bacterium]